MGRGGGPAGARLAPLLALPLALLLALPLTVSAALPLAPRSARAQVEDDRLAVIAAFTGAWNAHDPKVVGALFAPGGSVRQRDVELTQHGPTVAVRDLFGVAVDYDGDPPSAGPGPAEVTWASGRREVRAWARRLFAAGHRVAVTALEADGDGETVRWDYAVTSAAVRRVQGVGPTRGHAEAVLRHGQIVSLTLRSDAESVGAREAELALALARRLRRGP
jgi:hypothetical protein